jgi:hypothetical protein
LILQQSTEKGPAEKSAFFVEQDMPKKPVKQHGAQLRARRIPRRKNISV